VNVPCVCGEVLKMLVSSISGFSYGIKLSELRKYGGRKLLIDILVYELADI
jgi:hypothetical protein